MLSSSKSHKDGLAGLARGTRPEVRDDRLLDWSPIAHMPEVESVKPKIFIASSVEGKSVSDALEIALEADGHCTAWHEAFPLSNTTIDILLRRCGENDFAVFVFSPDDRATIRSASFEIARDNVLFEAGLFMGMHGKERGFIVIPQDNPSFRMPTDFLGFTTAKYDPERAKKEPSPALGAAAALVRQSIKNSGCSEHNFEIRPYVQLEPGATYQLKLRFDLKNRESVAAAIESRGFAFPPDLPADPGARIRLGDRYPFEFHIGRQANKDKYVPKCVVESLAGWPTFRF